MAVQENLPTSDINDLRRVVRESLTKTYRELGLSDGVVMLLTSIGWMNRGVITYAMGAMSGREPEALSLAASTEMMHRASVITDDIEDGDTVRRGSPCFHVAVGASRALAVADLILSNAMYCLGEIGLSYLTEGVETYRNMSRGQALDVGLLSHEMVDIDLPASLKTGTLIRMCFRVGAQLSELPTESIDTYGQIGLHFGCAFQLQNDLNNILGTETRDSQPGSDLLRGNASSVALASKTKVADNEDSLATVLTKVEALRNAHFEKARKLLDNVAVTVPGSVQLVMRDFLAASGFVADQRAE